MMEFFIGLGKEYYVNKQKKKELGLVYLFI